MMTRADAQPLNPINLMNRDTIKIISSDPLVGIHAKIKLIPNAKALTLHLDTLNLRTSPVSVVERKTVSLAIPMAVPSHKRLVIHSLTETGSTIHRKSMAQTSLSSEVFIAGSKGIIIKQQSKVSGKKILSLTSRKILKSACGKDLILRLNKSILSQGAQISSQRSTIQMSLEDC